VSSFALILSLASLTINVVVIVDTLHTQRRLDDLERRTKALE
jgi:hypothetical protein